MKAVFFLAITFIFAGTVTAQTIMSPIDVSNVEGYVDFENGVWYTNQYGGSFVWVDNKKEAEKFLSEIVKEFEIDLKSPYRVINNSSYYKSVYCESMQIKWVKIPGNDKMLLIRVYI